jgi:hypothetical protein
LPVDDRLGMPDRGNITGLCDLVGCLISTPPCHDDEKAMIVLRRPGPMQISEADTYIFRMVRQACADQKTAPWAFHVVGPDGRREVTAHQIPQASTGLNRVHGAEIAGAMVSGAERTCVVIACRLDYRCTHI